MFSIDFLHCKIFSKKGRGGGVVVSSPSSLAIQIPLKFTVSAVKLYLKGTKIKAKRDQG